MQGSHSSVGLKWLMTMRIVVVTALLGTTILVEIQQKDSYLTPFLSILYILIIVIYLLTIIYSLLVNRIKNTAIFAYVQIVGDILFDTALVYLTGGMESPFVFLYFLAIITAGIVLFRIGGFVAASVSSLLFVALVIFQTSMIKLLPLPDNFLIPLTPHTFGEIFLKVFLNVAAFYLVAFFSGVLLENLKKTHEELEEKSETVRELERFNENILESLSNGLVTTDLVGKINSFNMAAEKITMRRRDEVIGKDLGDIFPRLNYSECMEILSGGNDSQLSRELEMAIDGETRYIEISLLPLKTESGVVTGMIGNFQDRTEVKKMEENLKRADRLAAIGEVAAGIAHEIRNPLASISGSIQMLRETTHADGMNRKLMDITIKESDRLDSIIKNFLQYARPVPANVAVCNVVRILTDVVTLIKNDPKCDNKNVNIRLNCESDDLYVKGDGSQLEQVFWNLAINAIEAMNGREGELEITAERYSMRHDYYGLSKNNADFIRIIFADTGVGIKAENRNKIFSPFYTTKTGGTGLGLSIVYRILEEQGGKIEVDSVEWKGTKFFLYLPCFNISDGKG